jgi:hypothetical protein
MGFRAVLFLALAVAPLYRAAAADFVVRLGLTNAHILEVFLGCHSRGTTGYDRALDDFAPPPGIDTGYVGFFSQPNLPLFYKDIRGPTGPHEWTLQVRPAKDRPVAVSWDPKALPAGWTFTVVQGDKSTPMAEATGVSVAAAGSLIFRAVATPTAAP